MTKKAQNAELCLMPFANPESIVRGGPTLTTFFLLVVKRIHIPLSAQQRNANIKCLIVSIPDLWPLSYFGSFVVSQMTTIAKKPYIL